MAVLMRCTIHVKMMIKGRRYGGFIVDNIV